MTPGRPAGRHAAGLLALAVCALLSLGACTGAGGQAGTTGATRPTGGGSATPTAASSELVAKAGLAPCPNVPPGPPPAKGIALPIAKLDCLGTGPAVHMNGLRGPYVLTLWASWCPPCRREAPLFQRLHASHGAHVLGVDTDDADAPALQFAIDHKLTFPSVADPTGTVRRTTQMGSGLPVTLFVDRAGNVTYRRPGSYATYRELQADVRKHLKDGG